MLCQEARRAEGRLTSLLVAADGAPAKQDWFTRYSQYLLSNTLNVLCEQCHQWAGKTKWSAQC